MVKNAYHSFKEEYKFLEILSSKFKNPIHDVQWTARFFSERKNLMLIINIALLYDVVSYVNAG